MPAGGFHGEAKTVDALKTKMWPASFAKDAKVYEASLDDSSAHYEIASPNDFVGKKAQVNLQPSAAATHPASGQAGDLFVDKNHRLWFCKGATWKQLA